MNKFFLGAPALAPLCGLVLLLACGAEGVDPLPQADAGTDAKVSESGPLAKDSSIDADELVGCEGYAKAYCARLNACAPGYFFPSRYLDLADCEAANLKTCTLAHASSGARVLSGDACAAEMGRQSCADLLARKAPEVCAGKGTRANGTACGADMQCESGFCAKVKGGCGVCAAETKVGESCVEGRCSEGQTCGGDLGPRKCAKLVDIGSPCDATKYCRFGLTCVSGTCADGLPESSPCSAGGDGTTRECDVLQGLTCNGFGTGAQCAKWKYVGLGKACGYGEERTDAGLRFHPTSCTAEGTCPHDVPGDATCEVRGKEGEACDEARPATCRENLTCRNGKCVYDDPGLCK